MNHQPRRIVVPDRLDVRRAHGLEHLAGTHHHVVEHLLLVLAVRAVDAQRGNAPGVDQVRVDLDVVLVTR